MHISFVVEILAKTYFRLLFTEKRGCLRFFYHLISASSIFHAVWSTAAMASTIAFSLSYKRSVDVDFAIPRGMCVV